MKNSLQRYIDFFEKTLNISNICWWIIDIEENPDKYYCNELMRETFSLDKITQWHCVDETSLIVADYKQLLNQNINEYDHEFTYFNEELNRTLYFSSRTKTLETNDKDEVSVIYGIIEDITTQEEQKQEIEILLNTDKLTGLYNRHKIENSLNVEIKRTKRYANDLSLIIANIDNFKLLNNTHGHITGDNLLVQVAAILKENTRETDMVARWSEEEFIVICPNTNIDKTEALANKFRRLIKDFKFDTVKNITASFGITELSIEDTTESFLSKADKALHKAKSYGNDRVEK